MKQRALVWYVLFGLLVLFMSAAAGQTIQMIYTSDAHYGITRAKFRGATAVNARVVNAAMIATMNALPGLTFPAGTGVNAGKRVGAIDDVIMTGDLANRQENGIQSDSASWTEFLATYVDSLTVRNASGKKATLLLIPGNHDVSNAIGFYRTMVPATDPTSMVGIYNMMLHPVPPMTNTTYQYATDKIHYSRTIGGIHCVFVNMWPDSAERIWIATDLQNVPASMPVMLFCHDQPDCESKHFTNPNSAHTINATDRFENMVAEHFKDGGTTSLASTIEQRGFVAFLKAHRNIKAYFHGNDNENNFPIYRGPDNDVALPVIQVDSPMKGNISAADETKLSFQIVSIDTVTLRMTVRECLWNTKPYTPSTPVVFGRDTTISLAVTADSVDDRQGVAAPQHRLNELYPGPRGPGTELAISRRPGGEAFVQKIRRSGLE